MQILVTKWSNGAGEGSFRCTIDSTILSLDQRIGTYYCSRLYGLWSIVGRYLCKRITQAMALQYGLRRDRGKLCIQCVVCAVIWFLKASKSRLFKIGFRQHVHKIPTTMDKNSLVNINHKQTVHSLDPRFVPRNATNCRLLKKEQKNRRAVIVTSSDKRCHFLFAF